MAHFDDQNADTSQYKAELTRCVPSNLHSTTYDEGSLPFLNYSSNPNAVDIISKYCLPTAIIETRSRSSVWRRLSQSPVLAPRQ